MSKEGNWYGFTLNRISDTSKIVVVAVIILILYEIFSFFFLVPLFYPVGSLGFYIMLIIKIGFCFMGLYFLMIYNEDNRIIAASFIIFIFFIAGFMDFTIFGVPAFSAAIIPVELNHFKTIISVIGFISFIAAFLFIVWGVWTRDNYFSFWRNWRIIAAIFLLVMGGISLGIGFFQPDTIPVAALFIPLPSEISIGISVLSIVNIIVGISFSSIYIYSYFRNREFLFSLDPFDENFRIWSLVSIGLSVGLLAIGITMLVSSIQSFII